MAKWAQEVRKVRTLRATDAEWADIKDYADKRKRSTESNTFSPKPQAQKKQESNTISSLTADQKKAYKLMMSGESCFLTGGAGTGKSFLLQKFIQDAEAQGKSVLVTAPTGIAAQHIGGATLHRTFGLKAEVLKPEGSPALAGDLKKVLQATNIVVIDEVSMMRLDVFEHVFRCLQKASKAKPAHKIQLVLCGDFCQLPPVIGERDQVAWENYYPKYPEGFAFQSPDWTFPKIELKKVIRQKDQDFADALNSIRLGDKSGLAYLNAHRSKSEVKGAVTLCTTNRTASTENDQQLSNLPGQRKYYELKQTGEVEESDLRGVERLLPLKVGAQVIITANDTEGAYVNGTLGKVASLHNDAVSVKLESGSTVRIERQKNTIYGYRKGDDGKLEKYEVGSYSQLPLKLGYAITVHRSQGQTYDKVNLKLGRIFASGQLYVALSRCRSIESTYFPRKLTEKKLLLSPAVKDFYEKK